MLAVQVACLFLFELQYALDMWREPGPVGAFSRLDPGWLGERRCARGLGHQAGRQPARPIVLASGETQDRGRVGTWLPLAGAFEELSGLWRDEHLVGETGQARELLGAAAHAALGHVRLPVPRQYRGGVDVAYRGQAFLECLEGFIRSGGDHVRHTSIAGRVRSGL